MHDRVTICGGVLGGHPRLVADAILALSVANCRSTWRWRDGSSARIGAHRKAPWDKPKVADRQSAAMVVHGPLAGSDGSPERPTRATRTSTSQPNITARTAIGLVAVLFDSSKAVLVRHPHRGSFVHECTTRDDCENLVQRPLRAHHAKMRANSTSARGSTLKACRDADAKLVELGDDLNASARADAIIDACSNAPRHAWSRADARFVLDRSWLPIRRCRTLARLGPQYDGSREGDGGKTVCESSNLLRAPGPCTVVSVGLKDDTRFESGVHQLAPHCTIYGHDETLSVRAANILPRFILRRPNFRNTSWRDYRSTTVQILKVDCEGCEFQAVSPFVDHVCTEQLMVEVHTPTGAGKPGRPSGPWERVRRVNELMKHLDARGFDVFALEPNPVYPENCWEWSLVRRTPCVVPRDRDEV